MANHIDIVLDHLVNPNPPDPSSSSVQDVKTSAQDTTDKFKAAIAEAVSSGKPVYVPPGRYYICETLDLHQVSMTGPPGGISTNAGLDKDRDGVYNLPILQFWPSNDPEGPYHRMIKIG